MAPHSASGTEGAELVLASLVNYAGDPAALRKAAEVHDRLDVAVYPSGLDLLEQPMLMAQVLYPGMAAQSPYPGIAIDVTLSSAPVLIPVPEAYQAASQIQGFRIGVNLPDSLAGTELLLQGFAITPRAENGVFASTDAHTIVIQ